MRRAEQREKANRKKNNLHTCQSIEKFSQPSNNLLIDSPSTAHHDKCIHTNTQHHSDISMQTPQPPANTGKKISNTLNVRCKYHTCTHSLTSVMYICRVSRMPTKFNFRLVIERIHHVIDCAPVTYIYNMLIVTACAIWYLIYLPKSGTQCTYHSFSNKHHSKTTSSNYVEIILLIIGGSMFCHCPVKFSIYCYYLVGASVYG